MSAESEILPVTLEDIPKMVDLSRLKRLAYEKVHPTFWKSSGAQGDQAQKEWFEVLLKKSNYILLKAQNRNGIQGFIIGQLMEAPSVYDPGGLTLMVDDFCVAEPRLWDTIGHALLQRMREIAKSLGAVQVIVACGSHDDPKKAVLKGVGYSPATEWYVG